MNVYSVVYRDDTNGDAICIGVTKTRESAVKLLNAKLDEVKSNIGDDSRINSVERYVDDEWTLNYDEAYVDFCKIYEMVLED